jgi:predicted alpha/beta hydrolase family esterase
MITSEADILIVPGLGGSAEDHWQSRWERQLKTAQRVVQEDWDHPVLKVWLQKLSESIAQTTRPLIMIGHSLGALAITHLPEDVAAKIKGAMLVTPPAASTILQIAEIDPAFAAPPPHKLLYPALLIASRDDPYSSYAESEALAASLGAEVVDAGASGHLNLDSGHGPWPEGLMRFAGFMKTLQ